MNDHAKDLAHLIGQLPRGPKQPYLIVHRRRNGNGTTVSDVRWWPDERIEWSVKNHMKWAGFDYSEWTIHVEKISKGEAEKKKAEELAWAGWT